MTNEPKNLNPRLTQRLLAYATVAGAAVACAPPAQARVVYTPAHKYVNQDFYLDLNHDGINDFHIHSYFLSGIGLLQALPVIPINRIAAVPGSCRNAYGAVALASGAVIGPGEPFSPAATCMVERNSSFSSPGPWGFFFLQQRYLGFEFLIGGKKHYGWARIEFNGFNFQRSASVLGYAYETTPGKAIRAGDEGPQTNASTQPATLGALAAGASALNSWRKEESKP
jgi:hypothetical protein